MLQLSVVTFKAYYKFPKTSTEITYNQGTHALGAIPMLENILLQGNTLKRVTLLRAQ